MAIDLKYGQVTTEHGDIPEDEPVFVLRAQDVAAVPTLIHYLSEALRVRARTPLVDGVFAAIQAFRNWQESVPTPRMKIPDS